MMIQKVDKGLYKKMLKAVKSLSKKIEDVPKNKTCEYSKYPLRMWCDKRHTIAVFGVCNTCCEYHLRTN